nr:NADH dehydrogenase subunit 2 [Extensus latus]
MKMNSTLVLFLMTMTVGVMVTLSCNTFLMMWVGLELSLISFIPMMTMKGISGSESSIKYFIVQSASSCLLILGLLFMLMYNSSYEFLILMSLSLKVGLAPFHNWVLSMVDGLDYFLLFILLSVMKISPIFIISYMTMNFDLMILMSLLFGSISGLNQNSIRKIMAFSSIYNLGFIISSIYMNSIWMVYLILYSLVLFMLIYNFMNLSLNYLNQFIVNNFDFKTKFTLWICLLSLGGMPPMLGFLNKIIIFDFMMFNKNYLILFFMISSSLLVMFFYIRISLISLMIFNLNMKWNFFNMKMNSYNLIMINFIAFPAFILIKIIM